eukprot:CAMPEP_0201282910 /NCGR_PEP_ID=MMETSP1317-20130820/7014_1 /ASSEMBLY_ACC=CAM_ASM_000770 /TAXON_ID=187299 /ORGANISM="Undescribed Undescribed, Strain Undescribed" /LENGTH=175 /DNA_ID=CAMNT_0047597219 /DNA_START=259 /DNA_END=786 /DNA_ORIENTATION=-
MCDYAVGLSRTFSGHVFPSERPEHFMMEVWNPLGSVGVITAFNFPVAVFGWNLALALVCGDLVLWKGASSVNLITIAVMKLIAEVLEKNKLPPGIVTLLSGGGAFGKLISTDPRLKLVSFTGSTPTGRHVSRDIHDHFGTAILELGGNNAGILMDDADLGIAIRACCFAAVGTAG